MKVIIISEENHGLIGIAKDMKSAFQFLLEDKWITENTDFFEPNVDCDVDYFTLKEIMEDLKHTNPLDTLMFLWESDEDYFDGQFYFGEEVVLEYD